MIVDVFLNLFYTFCNYLVSLLPKTGFPTSVNTGISNFFTSVYQYNSIFPIDTAITILSLTAGFFGLVMLWEIIKWIIHLVRGN